MNEFEQRLEDLAAALAAAAPARIVTRDYQDRAMRAEADLVTGVFTVIGRGGHDFANRPGRMADLGASRALVTGQLLVDEAALGREAVGSDVEAAEFDLLGELQAMAQGALPTSIGGLRLVKFDQSGQLETPYGWIASVWEIDP